MKKTSGGGGGECDAGEKTDCHVAALLAMTAFGRCVSGGRDDVGIVPYGGIVGSAVRGDTDVPAAMPVCPAVGGAAGIGGGTHGCRPTGKIAKYA